MKNKLLVLRVPFCAGLTVVYGIGNLFDIKIIMWLDSNCENKFIMCVIKKKNLSNYCMLLLIYPIFQKL